MKPIFRRIGWCLLVACAAGPVPGAGAQGSRGALARGGFAITNVNLISMSSDSLMAGATVLVRDGRIAVLGPSIEAVSIGGRWLERPALDRIVRRATERLKDG